MFGLIIGVIPIKLGIFINKTNAYFYLFLSLFLVLIIDTNTSRGCIIAIDLGFFSLSRCLLYCLKQAGRIKPMSHIFNVKTLIQVFCYTFRQIVRGVNFFKRLLIKIIARK